MNRLVIYMETSRSIIIFIFISFFITLIVLSMVYYDSKKTVSFETGTEEIILTEYVNKNGLVQSPDIPVKEGYVFKEWQLNGETYDFNSKVVDDIVLTAKWIKEEYIIINFITNTDEYIKSIKILKGNAIEDLPTPDKEGYKFIGWYLNDKLYTKQEINSNITLSAEYESDRINTIYKKGDIVYITGNYSNSAHGIYAENKIAIGWKRKILCILEDTEFPYVIGNETGVTGFFKASSIKKINEGDMK